MYAKYFGLGQQPFSIAPDPRYLFMSERHREALAHLLYGVRGGGGFVLLTGEVGAGKTTVCRCFMEQIPKRCNVAYIFNPKLTVHELMKSVCDEFRIPYRHQGPGSATIKDYIDPLNEFLLRTHAVGQNNVLIIDEAQNLSPDVLEQLRLLTNLETNERKLLQIILIGQPELRSMLARPDLEQLAQRVIARYHLEPLSETETAQYIRHRLGVAGMRGPLPFEPKALHRIYQLSRGVPRRINLLCDRTLLGAYAHGKATVDSAYVERAADEVFDEEQPPEPLTWRQRRRLPPAAALGLALLLVLLIGAGAFGVVTLATDGKRTGSQVAAKAAPAVTKTEETIPSPKKITTAATGAAAAATGATTRSADPAPVDLKSLGRLIRTEKEAWHELAAAWNLTLVDGDPCAAAQRQQILCFRSNNSNLPLIRQLSRPGVLTLHDANNRVAYVLLTGLSSKTATVRIGGVSQTVSLVSLTEMWRGDFWTFWRAPPGYLSRSTDAEASAWIATQLASIERTTQSGARTTDTESTAAAPSDTALKSKIHAFQLAHGLNPDGRAGPITLMQLNRAAGVDEPRLQTD